jgi:hypothetical protein
MPESTCTEELVMSARSHRLHWMLRPPAEIAEVLPLALCPLDHPATTDSGARVVPLHVLPDGSVEAYQQSLTLLRLPAVTLAQPDPRIELPDRVRLARRETFLVGYLHGATSSTPLFEGTFHEPGNAGAYACGYRCGTARPAGPQLAGSPLLRRFALTVYGAVLMGDIAITVQEATPTDAPGTTSPTPPPEARAS